MDINAIKKTKDEIIMDINEHKNLFTPKIISTISYEELLQTSKYQDYVNKMSVKPLFNIVRQRAKNMRLKDIRRD